LESFITAADQRSPLTFSRTKLRLGYSYAVSIADAIRTQVTPDFYDHAAGTAMTADEGDRAFGRAPQDFRRTEGGCAESIVAEGDTVAARLVW
jgi:hypothetical protein